MRAWAHLQYGYTWCVCCECMYAYTVWVCMLGCMHEYVYVCSICMCTGVCSCEFMCSVACCSDADSFVRSEPVTGDSDPIRIHDRYGPDSQAIRRPIHRIIGWSVLVRAVKSRQRFDFKIASFHVSICSCIIFLIYHCLYYYMLPVSFHVTVWDILTVLLSISLHETSVNSYRIYLVDMNTYWRHFMWWLVASADSGLVVIYPRLLLDLIYWLIGLTRVWRQITYWSILCWTIRDEFLYLVRI